MNIIKYIENPHDRVIATHFLVIFILFINLLFFTQNEISILLQSILIFAVFLHNKDDIQLKDELLNSQQQLKEDTNIFDRNIIVSEADLEGLITYVNPKFCEISGYAREELIGQPHSILRDPHTDKEFFKKLWNTIESGETFSGILKNIRKDGTPYWVDMSISPIMKTGFHRDITDQERQTKMIESQNRVAAMGEMIGNIAHQWRQPIGAINNVLNDLEFDIDLDDLEVIQATQFLEVSEKVKEYTAHLSQTIDDFRSISSDEKVKSKFYIQDVLEAAYNIVATEYEDNQINFSITSMENCTCEFNGYKRELMQVIINILNNAKDILLLNKIANPRVIITLLRNKTDIIVMIHDNAGGISDAIIEKVFDPYFTTKHESVGTGIGLYMSKKIIIEHFDGTLSVVNENDGAKFIITVPRPNSGEIK